MYYTAALLSCQRYPKRLWTVGNDIILFGIKLQLFRYFRGLVQTKQRRPKSRHSATSIPSLLQLKKRERDVTHHCRDTQSSAWLTSDECGVRRRSSSLLMNKKLGSLRQQRNPHFSKCSLSCVYSRSSLIQRNSLTWKKKKNRCPPPYLEQDNSVNFFECWKKRRSKKNGSWKQKVSGTTSFWGHFHSSYLQSNSLHPVEKPSTGTPWTDTTIVINSPPKHSCCFFAYSDQNCNYTRSRNFHLRELTLSFP